MKRTIGTLCAILIVYFAAAYISLEWNPIRYTQAGRYIFACCVLFAGLFTATCPFWDSWEWRKR